MGDSGKNAGSAGKMPGSTLSPLAIWAIALGCVVGWGCFVMPGTTFLPAAGPAGTAVAFGVGTLAILVPALSFGKLAHIYPGKRGVYAYIHEVFGPNLAFVCSWCLVLAYSAGMMSNTTALALVARGVLGDVLQFGFHYVVAGYDVYLGELLVAFAATVAGAAVCLRGMRTVGAVQMALALGMMVGTVLICVLAYVSPQFAMGNLTPAFSPANGRVSGTVAVLAVVPFAFIGFEVAFQESCESRFSASKMGLVVVIAILCGAFVYLVMNTVTAGVVPQGYATWYDYLQASPDLQGLASLPAFNAAYLLAGNAGVALFAFTALCSVLTGVVGFYLASTRLISIMAKDGAIIRNFAQSDERTGMPKAAIVLIFAIAIVVPFFGRTVLAWAADLMSLGALVAYAFVCAATFKIGRVQGNRKLLTLGVVGVVLACVMTAVLVVPLPGLGSSLSKESYILLVAWVALGVNFFTPTSTR